jgi:hypothetical protein
MMTGTLGILMWLMMAAMLTGVAAASTARLRRHLKRPRWQQSAGRSRLRRRMQPAGLRGFHPEMDLAAERAGEAICRPWAASPAQPRCPVRQLALGVPPAIAGGPNMPGCSVCSGVACCRGDGTKLRYDGVFLQITSSPELRRGPVCHCPC